MIGTAMLLPTNQGGNLAKLTQKSIRRIRKLKLDNFTTTITVEDWAKYEAY